MFVEFLAVASWLLIGAGIAIDAYGGPVRKAAWIFGWPVLLPAVIIFLTIRSKDDPAHD